MESLNKELNRADKVLNISKSIENINESLKKLKNNIEINQSSENIKNEEKFKNSGDKSQRYNFKFKIYFESSWKRYKNFPNDIRPVDIKKKTFKYKPKSLYFRPYKGDFFTGFVCGNDIQHL